MAVSEAQTDNLLVRDANVDFPPLATSEQLQALDVIFKREEDAKRSATKTTQTAFEETHAKLQDDRLKLEASWIQTYTGKKFYPLFPREEDICLQDVAHALSMQCRFTGHSKFHYSVAQHSVLVSYLCDSQDRMHGLLHDASEAYLQDLSSPLKRSGHFEGYKKIEKKLQTAIFRKFDLSEVEPISVKRGDLLALAIEAQTLLAPVHPEWKLPMTPPPVSIVQMSPEQAKNLFLERFSELSDIEDRDD